MYPSPYTKYLHIYIYIYSINSRSRPSFQLKHMLLIEVYIYSISYFPYNLIRMYLYRYIYHLGHTNKSIILIYVPITRNSTQNAIFHFTS